MLSPKRQLSYWLACGTATLIYRIYPYLWHWQEPRRDPFIWLHGLYLATSSLLPRAIFGYQNPLLKPAVYYTLLACTMVALGSLADTLVDNHSTVDLLLRSSTISSLQGRRKVIVHFLLGYVAIAEAEWRRDRTWEKDWDSIPFPSSENFRSNLFFLVPYLLVTYVLNYILSILYGFKLFQKSGCIFFCRGQDPLTDVIDSLLLTVTMDMAGPITGMISKYLLRANVAEATGDGEGVASGEDADHPIKTSSTLTRVIVWFLKAKFARSWYVG